MITVWAVEVEPGKHVCFYRDEFSRAKDFAKAHHTDVVEWTVSYRDMHELDFCG